MNLELFLTWASFPVQQMAKTANSKVVFVPMHLQSDVVGQYASSSGIQASEGAGVALGDAGRAGLLNSISDL